MRIAPMAITSDALVRKGLQMKRIKQALSDHGMTQKELAEKAGIDPATVSRIVNGKTAVYGGWSVRIAEALGWTGDPEELFEEMGE